MLSDADDLAARLQRIKELTDQLLNVQEDSLAVRKLAERIRHELDIASRQSRRDTRK